jgi:protein TonB
MEAVLDKPAGFAGRGDSGAPGLVPETGPEGPRFVANVGASAERHGWIWPATVALHGAAALAIVVLPLFQNEPLPEAAGGVRAFFVAPALTPAPPPPPPPAAARAAVRSQPAKPTEDAAKAFVAPITLPDRVTPEMVQDLGLGADGGVPGGVEGGVPGGIVGGIVSGLDASAAPPPPSMVRVGGAVKEPRKLKNVAPIYPPGAATAHI